MNSSRAFAYFISLMCCPISSHIFSQLGFNLSFCSIMQYIDDTLYKFFAKIRIIEINSNVIIKLG